MNLKEILMERDGIDAHEADELIADAKADLNKRLEEGEMPHDICQEWLNLEPDFIDELM